MENAPLAESARDWRRRLIYIRGILALALTLLVLLLASRSLSTPPWHLAALVLTALQLPTLLYWLSGLQSKSASARSQPGWLQLELTLDVLAFLALLWLAGGSNNPIAFYLLLPLLVAAISCRLPFGIAVLVITNVGWGVLLQWHWVASDHQHHSVAGVHASHAMAMWTVFFLLGLTLLALGQQLQQQSRRLQRRQALSLQLGLQRERMYQLAVRQADLAHEISTPLNSLIWLLDDLQPGLSDDQVNDLRERLQACSKRITRALRPSNDVPATAGICLSELVELAGHRTSLLMPETRLTFNGPEDPQLAPAELWQRILNNLAYNACDAGASHIDVRCERSAGKLLIQVADNGPVAGQAQENRPDGLGIGLALVETSLATVSGSIELLPGKDWMVARITIPEQPRDLFLENHDEPPAADH